MYCITILPHLLLFFFFNDTATTEIYTLSLHDALPILYGNVPLDGRGRAVQGLRPPGARPPPPSPAHPESARRAHRTLADVHRSEEHTSELQSRLHLVCRLLLEKKKKKNQKLPKNQRRN